VWEINEFSARKTRIKLYNKAFLMIEMIEEYLLAKK
jgi:hypothetical protein